MPALVARSATSPTRIRSRTSSRSNSANASKMWKTSLPPDVGVPICSQRLLKPISLSPSMGITAGHQELVPRPCKPKATNVLRDRLPRRVVAREVSLRTCRPEEIADGVEDAADRMAWPVSACYARRQVSLYARPFRIGEVT